MVIVHSVMHPWDEAIFSGYTYLGVYASADSTVTINGGSSILLAKGSQIDIEVNSITSTTSNVYLLGLSKNVTKKYSIIGGSGTGYRGF